MNREWWKKAVIYQIYPKSFKDSNGDGFGDLKGIISKLDYLKLLGIDAIWLCPVYVSPQKDNGYDIADYYDVDPRYGTLTDMEDLILEAKKRDICILMDMVLNHTSDENKWFLEAKKSIDNPYHDFYVWRKGKKGCPPNDMKGTFGGSAWTWNEATGEFYFHQFADCQPDLNWDNPKVREALYEVLKFWVDKGVGGFRFDVIDQIAKVPDEKITANGPRLHEFIREMNEKTFPDTVFLTVGETWGATPELAKKYSSPKGDEFSMVFQFEHILLDQIPGKEKWDLKPLKLTDLKRVFAKWQTELYATGWNSLFWNNHDLPRIVSRWGNDSKEYRTLSAKMLATILYGLQGTPYIYQGEELGMTNIKYDIADYKDIETLNIYDERIHTGYSKEDVMKSIYAKSRDNARTPMQWNSSLNAGFSSCKPWIKVNPNYVEINSESEVSNPDSVFNYYKKLISLRKKYDVFCDGKFKLLCPDDEKIFAYTRETESEKIMVVCNFGEDEVSLGGKLKTHDGKILISNYGDCLEGKLRAYEAYVKLW
ncbi:MAG: alpha-glucosidase [Lachnospiraceae bacterium]|nr:alpha-glucosidase [Lachnospiraceae bacterium]